MLRRAGSFIENSFFFFAISVAGGGYIGIPNHLAGSELDFGASNIYGVLATGIILAGLVIVYGLMWRQIVPVAGSASLMNIFVLLALASGFSSSSPMVSFRRTGTLIIYVAFAYYAVARFPMRDIIRRVAVAAIVAAFVSAILALARPDIGVMTGYGDLAGSWNGVYSHKNLLGSMTVIGAFTSCWLFAHERRRRGWYAIGLALMLLVVVMSRSRTSQLAIAFSPFVLYGLRVFRLPALARLWAIYVLAVAATVTTILCAEYFGDIMVFLGKDASLTGRGPMWAALISAINQRPLIGYGYGAFFIPGNLDMEAAMRMINWLATEAHNDMIDLALQIGIPGAMLTLILTLDAVRLGIRQSAKDQLPWASLAATFLIISLLVDCVEALLFNPDIFTILFTIFYASLRRLQTTERSSAALSAKLSLSPVHRSP